MDSVTWEDREGVRWIALEGELDHDACHAIWDQFQQAVAEGEGDIFVVMGGVTFICSMGIGILVNVHQALAKKDRALKLSGLRPGTRTILDEMNLLELFKEV